MGLQTLRLVVLGSCFAGSLAAFSSPARLFVSTDGNDSWSGRSAKPNKRRSDGPLATLEAARNAIRTLRSRSGLPDGGVTVWIRGGTYRLSNTLTFGAEDAGTAKSSVTYAAYKGEEVRISGGLPVGQIREVTDRTVLGRLAPEARGKVLQADLGAQGVRDLGKLTSRGFGRDIRPSHLELFINDKRMKLAQCPNTGWLKIAGVPSGQQGGQFTYDSDRPAQWKDPTDVWVHGYWTWDWADSYERVQSIDAKTRTVTTEPPHGIYGYTKDRRFVFLNVFEELDEPGEYWVDRKSATIYFWAPTPLATAKVEVSVLETPLVSMQKASHIRLKGLIFECSRASGVEMAGGQQDLVEGCTFRNLGTYAITIDGQGCGVRSCDIHDVADGGVVLSGGNRTSLTPGHNFVVNCDIHDYQVWDRTYRPGVHIFGVGNRVANNRIHDAPHCAILLHGNDHLIEYNDIFRVCMETSDAGAFYLGRDFTELGNVVQYNYFHDVGTMPDVQAVYLDDWASGTTVFGNVFVDAGRCVQIGGGRDNVVENNIMVNGRPAVHVDARGLGWASYYFKPDGDKTLWDRLKAMQYDKPPFSTKYKGLAEILSDDPAIPKRNRIANNIAVGGRWLDLLDGFKAEQIPVLDNWVGTDPGFLSIATRDFRIKRDTPAAKLKFRPIPLSKIGLVKDEYRKRLPAVFRGGVP